MFRGSIVALVTPFKEDFDIDFEAYGRLIDWHLESGTDGLVPCGCTGEAATLTHDEQIQCIKYTVERVAGRVPVIAGTGSNSTREALSLTEKAYGRDDPSTAYVAGLVAFVCREAGLSEDAAGLIERALAIWEVARDDAKIVSALQSLGAVYSDLGDYERAAASLERALKIIIVCQTGAK